MKQVSYEDFVSKGYWLRWYVLRRPSYTFRPEYHQNHDYKNYLVVKDLVAEGRADPEVLSHYELIAWLHDTCQGRFLFYGLTIAFENRDDAALFKMTWSGK